MTLRVAAATIQQLRGDTAVVDAAALLVERTAAVTALQEANAAALQRLSDAVASAQTGRSESLDATRALRSAQAVDAATHRDALADRRAAIVANMQQQASVQTR